jgi:ATP-dependent RNA helicase RhlE
LTQSSHVLAGQTSRSSVVPLAPICSLAERFDQLDLPPEILRAVREVGYERPTPIQARAIPVALAGRDLFGCAQTGTGKTAAFALPILTRLRAARPASHGRAPIRALVLAPTRELASQIAADFQNYARYTDLRTVVVFGGVSQHRQEQELKRNVDILVATPGRLQDLISQRVVVLSRIEVLVLDEADRMLDMGFLPSVKRIIGVLPRERQTLFFSATMPPSIEQLASTILKSPEHVAVAPAATTVEKVAQSIYFVGNANKGALLEHILREPAIHRALIFTRTKRGADRVTRGLVRASIQAEAIHGNKSQPARERVLHRFKTGSLRVLVATDIAARGIDVDSISHIVNYELPEVPETYVHRIGRTARAGASGVAFSFCDPTERTRLRDIERLIRMNLPVVEDHPFRNSNAQVPARQSIGQRGDERRNGRQGGGARSSAATRSGDSRDESQARGNDPATRGVTTGNAQRADGGSARPTGSHRRRRFRPR